MQLSINKNINKKKVIIILIVLIILLSLPWFISLVKKEVFDNSNSDGAVETIFEPEFLSDTEKQSLGIPIEETIQVMSRDMNNEISVYRVINDENKVVDPSQIIPLSPQIK